MLVKKNRNSNWNDSKKEVMSSSAMGLQNWTHSVVGKKTKNTRGFVWDIEGRLLGPITEQGRKSNRSEQC